LQSGQGGSVVTLVPRLWLLQQIDSPVATISRTRLKHWPVKLMFR
jgi:hypothetical protein